MLQLNIKSPFVIDAFNDMIMAIVEQKKFYEYHVTGYTRINGLERYFLEFYDEKVNIVFSGIIDIWKEDKTTYVEFTEL